LPLYGYMFQWEVNRHKRRAVKFSSAVSAFLPYEMKSGPPGLKMTTTGSPEPSGGTAACKTAAGLSVPKPASIDTGFPATPSARAFCDTLCCNICCSSTLLRSLHHCRRHCPS